MNFKKASLPVFIFAAASQTPSFSFSTEDLIKELRNHETISLNDIREIAKTTPSLRSALNGANIDENASFNISVHEEQSTVDFSTFDGLAISIPFDQLESNPQNDRW